MAALFWWDYFLSISASCIQELPLNAVLAAHYLISCFGTVFCLLACFQGKTCYDYRAENIFTEGTERYLFKITSIDFFFEMVQKQHSSFIENRKPV